MFSCVYWTQHVNFHSAGWKNWMNISSNLNQMFPVVADQTCTVVRRNFGPFRFTKLFKFSSILGMSCVSCFLEVMPQHLNWFEFRTLNGPLHKDYFLLLKQFCCWFTSVFWVVVLLHHPSSLCFQLVDRWPYMFSCRICQ